jgi:hypothetical protein
MQRTSMHSLINICKFVVSFELKKKFAAHRLKQYFRGVTLGLLPLSLALNHSYLNN